MDITDIQTADTTGHGKGAIANEPVKEADCGRFSTPRLLYHLIDHAADIDPPIPKSKGPGKGAIAKHTIKEVLRVVVGVSSAFPPLKLAATGLLEIFERYDVSHMTYFICYLLTLLTGRE